MSDAHIAAFNFFESEGDLALALQHHKALSTIRTHIEEEMAETNFSLLHAEFDATEKDLAIEKLQRENLEARVFEERLKSNLKTVAIGLGGLFLAGLCFHLWCARQSAKTLLIKNDELAEALSVRDTFLATTSHEIRTPLNAVIALSEVITEDPQVDPDTRTKASTIRDAGDLLLSIVTDILDISKMERGDRKVETESVDISELVSSIRALYAPTATKKGIPVTLNVEEQMPAIVTDGRLLRQAINNLVANAVKFTDQGLVQIEAWMAGNNETLVVKVTDTSPGIPADHLERIFNSFYQVDGSSTRAKDGTGLGLAITKRIAELLSGEIEVRSHVGRGLSFTLTLNAELAQPRREMIDLNPRPEPDAASHATDPSSLAGLSVLLAEDNSVNQMVVRTLLSKHVERIDIASDGREALELVRIRTYDLIFMDQKMPEMTGIESIRHIRSIPKYAATPILGVTADPTEETRSGFLDAGADAIVTKPLSGGDLLSAIASAVDRRTQRPRLTVVSNR